MALDKGASLMDAAQFLAAQARVLRNFHYLADTCAPAAIGFVKCAVRPSPIPASIIFSTSLPLPVTESHSAYPGDPLYAREHRESIVRLALHTRMRGLLQAEATGAKLSSIAGRCSEDLGFVLYVILRVRSATA